MHQQTLDAIARATLAVREANINHPDSLHLPEPPPSYPGHPPNPNGESSNDHSVNSEFPGDPPPYSDGHSEEPPPPYSDAQSSNHQPRSIYPRSKSVGDALVSRHIAIIPDS